MEAHVRHVMVAGWFLPAFCRPRSVGCVQAVAGVSAREASRVIMCFMRGCAVDKQCERHSTGCVLLSCMTQHMLCTTQHMLCTAQRMLCTAQHMLCTSQHMLRFIMNTGCCVVTKHAWAGWGYDTIIQAVYYHTTGMTTSYQRYEALMPPV